MSSARGWAPGKLILAGEHAVVYGHPALAGALSLGTTVTLEETAGPTHLRRSAIGDPRLLPALCTVLPAEGLAVDIASDLPVGCGLGSSAALAVAVVRALDDLHGRAPASFAELHARAFAVERAFHGNPSGVDHAVSALGGVVRYLRAGPVVRPLVLTRALDLVLINTGTPGNTAEMVAGVAARGCGPVLAEIGALVPRVEAALVEGDLRTVGALLDQNHALLQAIGVSTPALDAAVGRLRDVGAWGAKLAGAGGGGVAFGLFPADAVASALAAVPGSFAVRLGATAPAPA